MQTSELAKRLTHWTQMYGFSGDVSSRQTPEEHIVEFDTTTTKTRASSMVTRIKLIAAEVLGPLVSFDADKELLSGEPESRADLAKWRIFVAIPKQRRYRAA